MHKYNAKIVYMNFQLLELLIFMWQVRVLFITWQWPSWTRHRWLKKNGKRVIG